MHRAQVLIEPWQYEFLKARAERQGRSISAVLREILTKELHGKALARKKHGLEEIKGIINDPHMQVADIDAVVYGKRKR